MPGVLKVALAALVSLVAAGSAVAQPLVLDLSESSRALHFPAIANSSAVEVSPAYADYAFLVLDICNAMDLTEAECPGPRHAQLGGNAIGAVNEGSALIIFDRPIASLIGSFAANLLVAHEMGHHYCWHFFSGGDPLENEIEADRFAAAALRRMGASLNAVLNAGAVLDRRPSRVQPSESERVAALTAGWNDPDGVKDCR